MCQQFPFTWGQRRGEGELKKTAENDGGDTDCLFIWNIFFKGNRAREEKKVLFPPVLSR